MISIPPLDFMNPHYFKAIHRPSSILSRTGIASTVNHVHFYKFWHPNCTPTQYLGRDGLDLSLLCDPRSKDAGCVQRFLLSHYWNEYRRRIIIFIGASGTFLFDIVADARYKDTSSAMLRVRGASEILAVVTVWWVNLLPVYCFSESLFHHSLTAESRSSFTILKAPSTCSPVASTLATFKVARRTSTQRWISTDMTLMEKTESQKAKKIPEEVNNWWKRVSCLLKIRVRTEITESNMMTPCVAWCT